LPELADQIDLSNESEVFQDVGAVAVKALVSGTLDKLEPSFKSMQGLSWATMTSVGGMYKSFTSRPVTMYLLLFIIFKCRGKSIRIQMASDTTGNGA
jgi:hypothetical protein